jgi:malic enzyme
VSVQDSEDCLPIAYNWPQKNVDVIVVTDGSRVLGLGDLGVHGMGISVGKLVLYTAAGGIHPRRALPVCIDVGTNNKELQESPLYLGSQAPRCSDEDFFHLLDNFMEAMYARWPNVLVQFEDFENRRAVKLLERYRNKYLCFNDDIQGTGAVALAGILCSLRLRGKTFKDLVKERILVSL